MAESCRGSLEAGLSRDCLDGVLSEAEQSRDCLDGVLSEAELFRDCLVGVLCKGELSSECARATTEDLTLDYERVSGKMGKG